MEKPEPNKMDTREQIAFLIYTWDATHPNDRTRAEYLRCADTILTAVAQNVDLSDQALMDFINGA